MRTHISKFFIVIPALIFSFLPMLSSPLCATGIEKSEMPSELIRTIEMAQIGWPSGLYFSQLSGSAEVYIPIPEPEAVLSATLSLDLKNFYTVKTNRYLEIRGRQQVVKIIDLDKAGPEAQIEISINPSLVENGYLRLSFVYSGAASNNVCFDERASGDGLLITASSHLRLVIKSKFLRDARAISGFLPLDVNIAFPDGPIDLRDMIAALHTSIFFGARNGRVTFGPQDVEQGTSWKRGQILIRRSEDKPQGIAAISSEVMRGRPVILLSGQDPQPALDAMAEGWSYLTKDSPFRVSNQTSHNREADKLSFAALGFDMRPQTSADQITFDFNFDIAKIPVGKTIDSISLLLAAAPTPEGNGATVVAYLNDTIIGSGIIPNGDPHWFDFDLPSGLVTRLNSLRVEIIRRRIGGECVVQPTNFPAQVLQGSRLNLSGRSKEISHFSELRQAMQNGVDLHIASDIGESNFDLLARVAPIIASVVPPNASIRPVEGIPPTTSNTSFIFVSQEPPFASNPRVRFSDRGAELRAVNGNLSFDSMDLERTTVAQILSVHGRPGLWIKPGKGATAKPSRQSPLLLDLGDLAILADSGSVFALSTMQDKFLRIVYPDKRNLRQIFSSYRPWIVGGAWVIFTILILHGLRILNRSSLKHDTKK